MPDITPELLRQATLDDLLAIANSRFDVQFEPVGVGEQKLELLQMKDLGKYVDNLVASADNEDAKDSISLPFWAKVWPANVILSLQLDRISPMGGGTLLEIGAGGGLAGMVAARRGFEVTLSDLDENALLFARINALKNGLGDRCRVMRVDFTTDRLESRYDVIVGCEVLYRDHVFRPLAKFLVRSLVPSAQSMVLLARSYKRRATRFFNIADADFKISEKVVGCKSMEGECTDNGDTAAERHLIAISRLTPRKGARPGGTRPARQKKPGKKKRR